MSLVNVSMVYGSGNARVQALRDITLRVRDGDSLSIMGPSGSGKTTLMYVLGLLERPTTGEVTIDDRPMVRASDRVLSRTRLKRIGFVFQQFYLLPNLNALENVMLPMREAGMGRARARERARQILTDLGVGNRTGHLPGRMSGGEQQRVAIARAMANGPEMILADEPTGELDSENSQIIMGILSDLNREQNVSMIVVTHDPEVARRSKRIIRIRDGRLVS